MGTQLEHAINLLAAPRDSEVFLFRGLDERGYSCNGNQKESVGSTGSARISESMGEPNEENSSESIRKKMQMQEDIFRKQVRELHRLYGIQKKLMGELKKEMEQSALPRTMKSHHANYVNCPNQTNQMPAGCSFHLQRLNDDRGSQERNASSLGEAMRIPRGLDLEIRPSRGDNTITDGELPCPSFTTPARRDAHIDDGLDEESDVELTLSIGGGSSKRKSKSYLHHCRDAKIGFSKKKHSSVSITSDHRDACNSNTSNIGESSTTSDQEKKRPRWLFQV